MKKFFLYALPFLCFIYSVDSLFFDIQFNYKIPSKYVLDIDDEKSTEPSSTFRMDGGVLSQYFKLRGLLNEMVDEKIPNDAKPDKTIDKLERAVLFKKVLLSVNIFLVMLCVTTFIGLYYKAWFVSFVGKWLFFIFIFIGLINAIRCGIHMQFIPILGFSAFVFNLLFFIYCIWGFQHLFKFFRNREPSYTSLYIASFSDEESNTGKIHLPFDDKNVAKYTNPIFSKTTIITHFIYIIFCGMVLGNLVYIPLFSLQKHYAEEFGMLIIGAVFFLSLFYIRNYYKIGKDESAPFYQNVLIGFSFLQYRFLRNLSLFFLTTIGVVLFVVALLLLLTLNTSWLVDFNVIERTINL